MAKDKKTVVIYSDWIATFDKLTDEEAGKLIKHLLRYVNDQNPEADRMTELLFAQMQQQLKRDLKKWEQIKEARSKAGRFGGIKSGETRRSKTKQNETNEAVNDNVNVNVINNIPQRVKLDINGNQIDE
jgi:hypothetical protein